MRRPLVAGNWKLNGNRAANSALLKAVGDGLPAGRTADVMVCPPFVYLAEIRAAIEPGGILLGAQNVAAEPAGAFTGEVSAAMLQDVGCSHVIVGHSERRAHFGETDELVHHKAKAALAHGLTAIICVGERKEERMRGEAEAVVRRQVRAAGLRRRRRPKPSSRASSAAPSASPTTSV